MPNRQEPSHLSLIDALCIARLPVMVIYARGLGFVPYLTALSCCACERRELSQPFRILHERSRTLVERGVSPDAGEHVVFQTCVLAIFIEPSND